MYRFISLSLLFLSATACFETQVCDPCNLAEGTDFCMDCPTTESCIATIESTETGEVLFECESAIGESCATDALVAMCPDV